MIRPVSLWIALRYAGARQRSHMVSFISGLSITGIVLGVALLVVVLSVMNGFDREMRERILAIVPQVSLYHREDLAGWQENAGVLERLSGVVAVAPFVQAQGLASAKQAVEPVVFYGVLPKQEQEVSLLHSFLSSAVWDQLSEADGASVVLGQGTASKLGVAEGDSISAIVPPSSGRARAPKIRPLKIIAVLKTGTELDHSLALVPITTAAMLAGHAGAIDGLRLKLDDIFQAPTIAQAAQNALPFGYFASDWTKTHGNLFQAIQMSRNLVGLLLLLIIGITAFNVVSTLVMVVVDKRGDIGILRTLGASSYNVVAVFVFQGALIGATGTLIGLAVGVMLASIAGEFVLWLEGWLHIQFLRSDIYPTSYLPVDIRLEDLVLIGMTSLGLSLLATIYPAWRAGNVDPADALRYD